RSPSPSRSLRRAGRRSWSSPSPSPRPRIFWASADRRINTPSSARARSPWHPASDTALRLRPAAPLGRTWESGLLSRSPIRRFKVYMNLIDRKPRFLEAFLPAFSLRFRGVRALLLVFAGGGQTGQDAQVFEG